MTERNRTDMTSESHDPKPAWTDPAPTTPVVTPAAPTAAVAPVSPGAAPAPASVVVAPPKRSSTWVNLLLGAAAVIAIGGVAFAVGRSTAPASAAGLTAFPGGGGFVVTPGASFDPDAVLGGGDGRPGGVFGTGGPTIDGTVASIDGDTMIITLPSGDTMTVTIDDDTTYHESASASASDIAAGDDVSVRIDGGRFQAGGDGGDGGDVTASDVTVSR